MIDVSAALRADLSARVTQYNRPQRRAISSRFPLLVRPATWTKRTLRSVYNMFTLKRLHREAFLPFVIARHSSSLYRKLGDSDPRLQQNKVTNLRIAIAALDGIVIPPGEIFSLWHILGRATAAKGYVPGMLLSNGRVSEGVGGGLCQLSNFLFWIFLHADVQIVERHHHSVDAFPDSGRTLPFGSGATVFGNYVDLKIRNTSSAPLQLKLWLTDDALKGQLLSTVPAQKKFHLREEHHVFIKASEQYFRYNELYRDTLVHGNEVATERVVTNFAPVIYPVTPTSLAELGYFTLLL